MRSSDQLVSIVAPVHNRAARLPDFVRETAAMLRAAGSHFELILVDDGSADQTREVVAELLEAHPFLRLVRLTRRFGNDIATVAGVESAIGDVVVVLQAGSDPPAEILRVLALLEQGSDVVQGISVNESDNGLLFRLCRHVFRSLSSRLLGMNLPHHSATLLGFTRRALNAITRVRHKHRPLALLGCSVGFPRHYFDYRKTPPAEPRENQGLLRAIDRGIATLVTHSVSPLRIVTYLGCFAAFLNLLYCLYVVGVNLYKTRVSEGWTTLSLQNSVMWLFVFLILASLSEYVSRILEETKDQPLYHVLEEQGASLAAVVPQARNLSAFPTPAAVAPRDQEKPHAA